MRRSNEGPFDTGGKDYKTDRDYREVHTLIEEEKVLNDYPELRDVVQRMVRRAVISFIAGANNVSYDTNSRYLYNRELILSELPNELTHVVRETYDGKPVVDDKCINSAHGMAMLIGANPSGTTPGIFRRLEKEGLVTSIEGYIQTPLKPSGMKVKLYVNGKVEPDDITWLNTDEVDVRHSGTRKEKANLLEVLPSSVPDDIVVGYNCAGTPRWYSRATGAVFEGVTRTLMRASLNKNTGVHCVKRVQYDDASDKVNIVRVFYVGEAAKEYSKEDLNKVLIKLRVELRKK